MSEPVTRKHALLLFTKPPIEGTVKTRLTVDKGGIFSEKRAAQFFECSLLDVTELCIYALYDLETADAAAREANPELPIHTYDFFVSTAPAENVQAMKDVYAKCGEWPREFHYITDQGSSFNEHFDDSFNQIFAMGYDTIVAVGADIPMLPREHISNAFRWLQYFLTTERGIGMVEAPCQECGVSLVGWTKDTPLDHQGVYYAMNGRPALDAYIDKAGENDVPFAHLTPVADVDDMQDLAHCISLAKAAEYASTHLQDGIYVPRRVLAWVKAMNLRVTTPPNNDFDSREQLDVPPAAATEKSEDAIENPDVTEHGTADTDTAGTPGAPTMV